MNAAGLLRLRSRGRSADLAQIGSGYPSCEAFLAEITLDPPNATSAQAGVVLKDAYYLVLSTIHSANGQEWKAVFVLNLVDDCMPSDLATGHPGNPQPQARQLRIG